MGELELNRDALDHVERNLVAGVIVDRVPRLLVLAYRGHECVSCDRPYRCADITTQVDRQRECSPGHNHELTSRQFIGVLLQRLIKVLDLG
jgi:hypothetical protein